MALVTGIIAEYNPFHNGHAYQIQKARELTGCDFVVVVMSGGGRRPGTGITGLGFQRQC